MGISEFSPADKSKHHRHPPKWGSRNCKTSGLTRTLKGSVQ